MINKCSMAGFLVVVTTLGFLGLIVTLIFVPIPDTRMSQVIGLVTTVATAWIAIITYYFGSSAGSARKTDMLNDLTGTGDGGTVTTTTTAKIDKTTTVTPEVPPTPPPVPPVNP